MIEFRRIRWTIWMHTGTSMDSFWKETEKKRYGIEEASSVDAKLPSRKELNKKKKVVEKMRVKNYLDEVFDSA